METFFVYLVKSSVCILFYELFYRLFLRGETFHRLNRIVLLVSLILSLLLPLFDVSGWFATAGQNRALPLTELTVSLQELVVEQKTAALSDHNGMTVSVVLFGIYLTGVVLLLLKNLFVFVSLNSSFKQRRYSYLRLFCILIFENRALSFKFVSFAIRKYFFVLTLSLGLF